MTGGSTEDRSPRTLMTSLYEWARPPELGESDERRARLLLTFVVVTLPSALVFASFYLVTGLSLSALGSLFALALVGVSPFVMRRWAVTAATNTFLSGGVLGLGTIIIAQGGLESPVAGWLALAPWAATMLGGRTFGFAWAGFVLTFVVSLGSSDLAQLLPSSEVPEPLVHPIALLVQAGLLVLAAMMATSYESQRSMTFDSLVVARDEARRRALELEVANDQIAADAREQRRLELELRSGQRLQAVGRLAAGVAHEINTPLQYVSDSLAFAAETDRDLLGLAGRSRSALESAPPSSDTRQVLALHEDLDLPFLLEALPLAYDRAREGLERIARIISAMRELARPEGDAPEPLNLNRLVETTLTLAKHELEPVADVEVRLASDLPEVQARPAAIGQAILALLTNAAHAIADVGRGRGRVVLTTHAEPDWVVLTVTDTGTGIAAHIRDRVFEPFFTTKEVGRGTGQGLALSRHTVVQQHGGQLDFESEVGRGTTFTLRLPRRGLPELPSPTDQSAEPT